MFCSCENNVQQMLEDTNQHFEAQEVQYDYSLKPGDEGFEETSMLFSHYYVGTRMSISLFAPEAKYYWWSLYSLEKTETATWVGVDEVVRTEFTLPPGVIQYEQGFSMYIPEVPGLSPGTYELELQVRDQNEKIYRDVAQLIIYDEYYLETIKEEE